MSSDSAPAHDPDLSQEAVISVAVDTDDAYDTP